VADAEVVGSDRTGQGTQLWFWAASVQLMPGPDYDPRMCTQELKKATSQANGAYVAVKPNQRIVLCLDPQPSGVVLVEVNSGVVDFRVAYTFLYLASIHG
jgi:hypothetical protein